LPVGELVLAIGEGKQKGHTEGTVATLLKPVHEAEKVKIRMVAGHRDCRFCDGFQTDDAGIGDILLMLGVLLRYLL
jgi:hypothetical protein